MDDLERLLRESLGPREELTPASGFTARVMAKVRQPPATAPLGFPWPAVLTGVLLGLGSLLVLTGAVLITNAPPRLDVSLLGTPETQAGWALWTFVAMLVAGLSAVLPFKYLAD